MTRPATWSDCATQVKQRHANTKRKMGRINQQGLVSPPAYGNIASSLCEEPCGGPVPEVLVVIVIADTITDDSPLISRSSANPVGNTLTLGNPPIFHPT